MSFEFIVKARIHKGAQEVEIKDPLASKEGTVEKLVITVAATSSSIVKIFQEIGRPNVMSDPSSVSRSQGNNAKLICFRRLVHTAYVASGGISESNDIFAYNQLQQLIQYLS